MNIFRVNRLPFYQAPDTPAEPDPTENVLQAEPVTVEPAEPVVEAIVEPVVEPEPTTQEAEDKRKNPWFLKRISAEAEARRVAEQKAADLQEMVERLQAGKETPPAPPANGPDFNTAVQREAARMRLADDSTAIRDAGYREFGAEFGQSLAVLNAAGAVSDDIVLDLIAVDKTNAHKILATLAQDPERATALAAMDSRRRTAELTRISMASNAPTAPKVPAAPAAKQVSKAPPPAPAVEPSAAKVIDGYADDATDEQFTKQFNDRMKARGARR